MRLFPVCEHENLEKNGTRGRTVARARESYEESVEVIMTNRRTRFVRFNWHPPHRAISQHWIHTCISKQSKDGATAPWTCPSIPHSLHSHVMHVQSIHDRFGRCNRHMVVVMFPFLLVGTRDGGVMLVR